MIVFTLKNLSKLAFMAFNISEKNYLLRILNAEIHLAAMGRGDCVIEGNKASSQNKMKLLFFFVIITMKALRLNI